MVDDIMFSRRQVRPFELRKGKVINVPVPLPSNLRDFVRECRQALRIDENRGLTVNEISDIIRAFEIGPTAMYNQHSNHWLLITGREGKYLSAYDPSTAALRQVSIDSLAREDKRQNYCYLCNQ